MAKRWRCCAIPRKTLLQMSTLIKQQQVEKKQGGLALNQSLQSAQKRQSWYKDQIDKGLSSNEIQNIVYMTLATVFNTSATAVRTMASIGYAVPQVGSPFAMTYGGAQLGASLTAASGVLDGLGILANFGAQLNLTMAQYRRRESEWQLQSDLAGYDVAQIQYQIAANAAQQKITARDLEVQQTTLAQNEAMDAFLKNKFSSEELYQWMATRLSVLYFQTYQLALDLSRSVQRAYQYELNSDTSFVNFGYWDGGRRGLLAGEGLMLALNQMEKAYLDGNGRMEIEKTVSLLQLNPRAVLDLIETGECVFELPEKLFSDDFPATTCARSRRWPCPSRRHRPLPEPARHADPAEQPGHRQARPERDQLPAGRQRRQHAGQLECCATGGQPEHRAVARAGRQRHVRGLGRRRPLPALRRHGRGLLAPEPAPAVESLRLSQHHRRGAAAALHRHRRRRQAAPGRHAAARHARLCRHRFLRAGAALFQRLVPVPAAAGARRARTLSFTLADLVPDHVNRPVLTGIYLQVVTLAGVDASSSAHPGAAGPAQARPDRHRPPGTRHAFLPGRAAERRGRTRQHRVRPGTPASLKTRTDPQRLDPAVLQNLVLILFYEGEIRWS